MNPFGNDIHGSDGAGAAPVPRSAQPRIRKAVFPVAGLGTRFLPATKAVAKEMLPIVDRPVIQYGVEEALAAGADEIIFVTSRSKRAIEDHFDSATELEQELERAGKSKLLAELRRMVPSHVRFTYVRQHAPLGLGHAVLCARHAVGDEPFAVLLPDELMGSSALLDQMARLCEATGGGVVGLKEVPHDQVGAYGVIDPSSAVDERGVVGVRSMVEKPPPDEAPSDLIIIGRYVLTPDVFDEIDRVAPGRGGEIQLTDAMRVQAGRGPFHGVVSDVLRYDTGNPFGWLTAVVEIGLADAVIGPQLRPWLRELLG